MADFVGNDLMKGYLTRESGNTIRDVPNINGLSNKDPLSAVTGAIYSSTRHKEIMHIKNEEIKREELDLAFQLASLERHSFVNGKKWYELAYFEPRLSFIVKDSRKRSDYLRLGRILHDFEPYYKVFESNFSYSSIKEIIRNKRVTNIEIQILLDHECSGPENDRPSKKSVRQFKYYLRDLCQRSIQRDNDQPKMELSECVQKKVDDCVDYVAKNTKILSPQNNGSPSKREDDLLDFHYGFNQKIGAYIDTKTDEFNSKTKHMIPVVKKKTKIFAKLMLFPVFVDDESMMVHQDFIASEFCGVLMSYGIFKNNNRFDRSMMNNVKIMADCGAVQALRDPMFLNNNTPQDIAQFYNHIDADLVVEPDVIHENVNHSLVHGINKVKVFYTDFYSNAEIIRVIHGNDTQERMRYITLFDKVMGHKVSYYALGGIYFRKQDQKMLDDLNETLVQLSQYGVSRLHFLGVASSDIINLALEFSNLFETLSFDSSSYYQEAVMMKNALIFNPNTGKLDKLSFSENNKERLIKENAHTLNNCDCPICTDVHFKEEEGVLFPLGELGHRMFLKDDYYKGIFNRKCPLHNAYQFKQLFEWKAKNLL